VQSLVKAVLVAALVLPATDALAQLELPAPPKDPGGAPISIGRVQLSPGILLQDVGLDSNVYLRPAGREDFTYTISPKLKGTTNVGRAEVWTQGGLGFVYFQRAKDQQSINGEVTGIVQVREGRVRPMTELSLSRSRARVGDVDVRALSVSKGARAGIEVGVTGITSLTAWVSQSTMRFAPDETFAGVDLAEQLSRTATVVAGGTKFDLTPLTTLTVAAEVERATFDDGLRDYRGYRVAPTVRFGEGAIIAGRVSAGLRDYRPVSSLLPRYRGFMVASELGFSVHQDTRFSLNATRDVFSSYDELQPYYVGLQAQARVTQRVAGPFDAIGLGELRNLDYQARLDVGVPSRFERLRTYGGGIGIRIDEGMRLTITMDRQRRTNSLDAWRNFERTRVLGAVEVQP
jgi:hypothetical protein